MEARKTSTKYIKRLLNAVILIYFSQYLCSEDLTLFELKQSSDIYFLNSEFILELKINDKHRDFYLFKNLPKLIINNPILELIESTNSKIYGGILVKNKYKLNKTGFYRLEPKVISKKNVRQIDSFTVNIIPPEISSNTKFNWVICENNKNFTPVDTVDEKKKYIILLAGFFSNFNNVSIDVNCPAPENSILESYVNLESKDLNIIHTVLNNYFGDKGWIFLKAFYWTPLINENTSLPEATINCKSNNNIYKINLPQEKININKSDNLKKIPKKELTAKKTLNNALKNKREKNLENKCDPFVNFENRKKIACEIVKLRLEESKKIFNTDIRKKRIALEKQIGIYESVPVNLYKIKKIILSFIFFILLILGFIFVIKCRKKIRAILFLILLLIIPGIIYILINYYFIRQNKYKTAIYFPKDKNCSYHIYHIPEKTSSTLGTIKIGEAIIIKHEIKKWIFIEKKDRTGGWQKEENFLLCN